MKLTVLGGGGVRLPLLIKGLIGQGEQCPFDAVTLFDIEERQLVTMGKLAQYLLRQAHSPITLVYTTDIREALTGADFVFSAIRVGQNASRIIDERVALDHGVVGQETTGPGGFAMALRTIPVVVEYARIMRETAPRAWLLNFTNPAGIVTQALIDQGTPRTIGICDSPEGIKKRVAHFLDVTPDRVQLTYVGLNHLGWVTDVHVDGISQMPFLLTHYAEMSGQDAEFAAFDAELVQSLGMLPNEYLYYFYYSTDAVQNVKRVGETRSAQIAQLSTSLLSGLYDAVSREDYAGAWDVYTRTMGARSQTYMQREMHATSAARADRPAVPQEDAGYAGVALRVAQNILGQFTAPIIVNTPNQYAVNGLDPEDVVEVSASILADGPHPLAIGPMPTKIAGLVLQVKEYERLTVRAAIAGDRRLAIEALATHPVVPSYRVAAQIVDQYLRELREWLPQFD
jgi:6-phospho-beta-glucosidase